MSRRVRKRGYPRRELKLPVAPEVAHYFRRQGLLGVMSANDLMAAVLAGDQATLARVSAQSLAQEFGPLLDEALQPVMDECLRAASGRGLAELCTTAQDRRRERRRIAREELSKQSSS